MIAYLDSCVFDFIVKGNAVGAAKSLFRKRRISLLASEFHLMETIAIKSRSFQRKYLKALTSLTDRYDWDDLNLCHDFHETKQGVRFTISETARHEVLQRLLKLNHERYKEEVEQGLNSKRKGIQKKAPRKKNTTKKQPATLFGTEDGE